MPIQHILLVDDSKTELAYLSDLLAKRGFTVRTAENGEDAMKRLAEGKPDLILMDVVMPGIGGIAAARAIVRSHPDEVILLLSADDPAGYLGSERLGDGVACLRKQDLSPDALRRIWNQPRD